jgi:mercuric reductase
VVIEMLELEIDGMTCPDCARHATTALERVEGVEAARVDDRTGRGAVALARAVPAHELIAAVARMGYRAEIVGATTGTPAATAAPTDRGARTGAPAVAQGAARGSTGGEHGAADVDLFVVGTGGAGVAAAIQGAELGARVAIAEGGTLGGTCVNVGCIPSKNLIEAAAHYHAARRGFPGIAPGEPALDWRAVLAQKRALVEELRQAKYADVLASYPGITRLDGHARLRGGRRVTVGDVEYRARKIVIATGTSPAFPPIPGLDAVEALTSTTAMELDVLPRSMIVLGGSAVGLELGQTFARLGIKVTVLELLARLLPSEDEAISDALRDYLEAEGIEIHTGVATTRVDRDGSDVVVHGTQGGRAAQFRAERLLVAAGRRANTRELGLDEAGVALTARGFVQVDATMRTSHPDIYAAGDVTGGPGFVYVAAAGGRVAAWNALNGLAPAGAPGDAPRVLDLHAVPSVTFTSPQVGSIGLTEASARAAGHDVQVSVLAMRDVPRASVSRDTRGLVKLVAEAGSQKLLGVHAVAPHAGELLGEAALAIRFGLTARDIADTLHPYLTWGEALKLAAQGFATDVSRLSCCA